MTLRSQIRAEARYGYSNGSVFRGILATVAILGLVIWWLLRYPARLVRHIAEVLGGSNRRGYSAR